MPNTNRGYSSTEAAAWNGGCDAKLRDSNFWDGQVIVACDGKGLATIASYPVGTKKWAAVIGNTSTANLHSIELLPSGNVAIAASKGGWVRVYTASQGTASYFSYSLPGAHAVYWDPFMNVLWTVGDTKLVALTVGGTPSAPTLSLYREVTIPLTSGIYTPYGHDVWPVYNDSDRLWEVVNYLAWQHGDF